MEWSNEITTWKYEINQWKVEKFDFLILIFGLFSLSIHEKIDLQEVEINEQRIIIDELRNEIQRLNEPLRSPPILTINTDQKNLIEELDKRLYELETERTNIIFEHERLKTSLNLCIDEKQHLLEQKTEINNELKQSKLRILALQDQIYKLKRNNQKDSIPLITIKRRIIKKKPRTTKSCLEMLLDQNATFIDDRHNESIVSNRRPSIISRKRCSLLNILFSF